MGDKVTERLRAVREDILVPLAGCYDDAETKGDLFGLADVALDVMPAIIRELRQELVAAPDSAGIRPEG